MTFYLNERLHPDAEKLLAENATVVNNFDNPEEIDGILVRRERVPREIIEKCPNLKVIGRHGAGYDGVDIESAKEHNVHVVCVPCGNSDSVAEMIVGLALNLERRISEANKKCRDGEFTCIAPPDFEGTELNGKVFGSIGMGNIASRAAKILANGFDMKILGYDRHTSPEDALKKGFIKVDSIRDLIQQSDVVNISVPLNNGTRDMISGDVFDSFKPGAILINCSRGGVVNEDDLYNALKNGSIKAAACDVFVKEPPEQNNKLLSLSNFSATPHIGGNTQEAIRRTGILLVENSIKVINGESADGVVC